MEDLKDKVEKDWDELTSTQKIDAAHILKSKLVHNWLIPLDMKPELIESFLEVNKPKIIFHFPQGKETVLTLKDDYWKGLAFALQKRIYDKTGKPYLEEYFIEIPRLIGLDEIFNKSTKSK